MLGYICAGKLTSFKLSVVSILAVYGDETLFSASPPGRPIAALVVFWGPVGSYQRAPKNAGNLVLSPSPAPRGTSETTRGLHVAANH
jgi:hypothetical protein